MKIMSFNLLCKGVGLKEFEPRKAPALALIKKHMPDVMGVQEATPEWMEFLSESLPEYSYAGVGRDNGKNKGEYSAVFFKKSAFELKDQKTLWLSRTPHIPSKGWDARCTRIVTAAHLIEKSSGKELCFVNTHLDHRGEKAKRKGTEIVLKISKRFGEMPTFITGDLNSHPDHDVHGIIKAKGFADCREIAEKSDDSYTFHLFFKTEEEKLKAGCTDKDVFKIIDYIYAKNIGTVKSFCVIKDSFDGIYPSDHYPIMAEINI